ncbi:NDP-sugar synthase, partial [bacterium]|nr:NDP-sugar synthase [bacterium]
MLVRDIQAYYDLNMRLVKGENRRYVSQGYGGRDGASIGYNVQLPPSVELRPPFTIGNDCRFHAIAVIGPNAVIGNRVIVD